MEKSGMNEAPQHNCFATSRKGVRGFPGGDKRSLSETPVVTPIEHMRGASPVSGTSIADRLAAHNATLNTTRNHRLAIRSYCRGNKWLTENAKAVGNW
jgi:hypothetical protein